jgi:hypothetical protein
MLALAVAFCGMESKRALVGINDESLMFPPPKDTGPRGYVILGSHADWSSAPVKLTLDGSTEYAVVSEKYDLYDFMVRGLALADGSTDATVTCKDGTAVACVINVETVW